MSNQHPCDNTGIDTFHTPHLNFLREQKNCQLPQAAFCKGLVKAISNWMADGEQIVLGIDANQDVRTGPLTKALRSIGCREAIIAKHISTQPAPATQDRNMLDTSIDSIYTTLPLDTFKCGYLAFGDGLPGDHRLCWMDLPFQQALGHTPPHLHQHPQAVLNVLDPRLVSKYHKEVL